MRTISPTHGMITYTFCDKARPSSFVFVDCATRLADGWKPVAAMIGRVRSYFPMYRYYVYQRYNEIDIRTETQSSLHLSSSFVLPGSRTDATLVFMIKFAHFISLPVVKLVLQTDGSFRDKNHLSLVFVRCADVMRFADTIGRRETDRSRSSFVFVSRTGRPHASHVA